MRAWTRVVVRIALVAGALLTLWDTLPRAEAQESTQPATGRFPPQVTLAGQEPSRVITVAGAADFPDGAVVHLAVVYAEDDHVGRWGQAQVRAGRYASEFRLEGVKLYPGRYRLESWFVLNRQPMSVIKAVSEKRRVSVTFQEKFGWAEFEVGAAADLETGLEAALERFAAQTQRAHDMAVDLPDAYSQIAGSGAGLLSADAAKAFEDRLSTRKDALANLRQELRDWEAEYLYLPFGEWIYRIEEVTLDIEKLCTNYVERLESRLALQNKPDPELSRRQEELELAGRKLEILTNQDSAALTNLFAARLEGLRAMKAEGGH